MPEPRPLAEAIESIKRAVDAYIAQLPWYRRWPIRVRVGTARLNDWVLRNILRRVDWPWR